MTDDFNFTQLIEELPRWNNGAGISPEGWIGAMGNYELAVGYSLVFWPRFERIGHCIVRQDIGPFALDSVKACAPGDAAETEALVNHLHLSDLHYEAANTEAQLRYLGRVLKQIWEAKLRIDFPGVDFEVAFNDEPRLALQDYQLTFWQSSQGSARA